MRVSQFLKVYVWAICQYAWLPEHYQLLNMNSNAFESFKRQARYSRVFPLIFTGRMFE